MNKKTKYKIVCVWQFVSFLYFKVYSQLYVSSRCIIVMYLGGMDSVSILDKFLLFFFQNTFLSNALTSENLLITICNKEKSRPGTQTIKDPYPSSALHKIKNCLSIFFCRKIEESRTFIILKVIRN